MEPIRIDVAAAAGRYTVSVAEGWSRRLDAALDAVGLPARRVFVSSPLVWKLHGRRIAAGIGRTEPILVPDGERFKQLPTVARIYDGLIRLAADRASVIVAVGGGVLGDMAGFAAATYLRGIRLVHVPTTLLAQVDSAIGGKVGVNHALGKNLIGAFYPPAAVIVDPEFLDTLPRREFRAGLYEVIKYGMIASRPLFERVSGAIPALFARERAALVPVVAECCRIKAAVTAADERERGGRRVLNFGHTVGHALEAITRYRRFRHGEAVGYGMLAAAEIGVARGTLTAADREALAGLIITLGPLPPVADLSVRQTLEPIARDKKIVEGRLHFVLPAGIGATVIVDDVKTKELERALRRLGMRA